MIKNLNWRYATKAFDTSKKISQADLDELLEALRLAPSSFGLQPWKFIVVSDPKIRSQLREAAWGQKQVTDASHLVVLCVQNTVDEAFTKKYIASMAKTRNVTQESLKGFEDYILNFMKNLPPEQIFEWSKRQVYIALGFLLFACAQKKIDACPMEGFEPDKFDKILGLEKEGLHSLAMCAIGYRNEADEYAHAKKSRFDKKEVFIFK